MSKASTFTEHIHSYAIKPFHSILFYKLYINKLVLMTGKQKCQKSSISMMTYILSYSFRVRGSSFAVFSMDFARVSVKACLKTRILTLSMSRRDSGKKRISNIVNPYSLGQRCLFKYCRKRYNFESYQNFQFGRFPYDIIIFYLSV